MNVENNVTTKFLLVKNTSIKWFHAIDCKAEHFLYEISKISKSNYHHSLSGVRGLC